LILFYDDLQAPASGKAKVRFVHLAPNVNDIQVQANTNVLFNSIAYGRAGNSIISGTGLNAYSLGPFRECGRRNIKLLFEHRKYRIKPFTEIHNRSVWQNIYHLPEWNN
jgi:hypothetical protein